MTEIQLPEKCAVLGILRENQVISVEDNPTICTGDYILVMAINPMMTPTLKVILKVRNVYLLTQSQRAIIIFQNSLHGSS